MTPSLFDDQDQPEVFDYEPQPWEADGDPLDALVAELNDAADAIANVLDHPNDAPETILTTPPARADVRHVEAPPLPASGIDADGHYHCSHDKHAGLPWCPWYPATGALQ